MKSVEEIPDKGPIFIFLGCQTKNRYPGIEYSTLKALKNLGYTPYTSYEEVCCGSFANFSGFADFKILTALTGWNIWVAEKFSKNLVTICDTCYGTFLRVLKNIKENSSIREVEKVLFELNVKPDWNVNIFHVSEVFYKAKNRILEKQKINLKGVKAAVHYGCHYVKSSPEKVLGNPEDPGFLEELITTLGGEVVEYGEKHLCCGVRLNVSSLKNPSLSVSITKAKLKSMKETGANLVVVTCPTCLYTFDEFVKYEEFKKLSLPVLHISEFIGLVLGFDALKELALQSHFTPITLPQVEDYIKNWRMIRFKNNILT
ncbi:MAG: heterodisulfide reductase-related iron-sulfur binding cluster [Candidatus Bathyarchaeota archaeon]